MIRRLSAVPICLLVIAFPVTASEPEQYPSGQKAGPNDKYAGYEKVVAETQRASLARRDEVLRKTVAKDSCWPNGPWGDTMWTLSALYRNEKVDEANARLLKRAEAYVALQRANAKISDFKPEAAEETPWAYFALTDYVRILCLFHAKSPHFPGRLRPDTEAAMKEALWCWAKSDSKVALASPDDLLLLLGTENHDLTRRPSHYLVAAILKDDPAFRDRRYDDGHTAAEHFAAYNAFFREWPRQRVKSGLWIELGSNTYQKYSWPGLFNLHELAPDPVVRKRFGLLLDLACIEEAQISVRGRRGGGRSRAEGGRSGFESYKNLLYGDPGGSSHSKVIETSHYQVPAAAILLRKIEFPADRVVEIRNRVLGELERRHDGDGDLNRFATDSALVNYAYRTPHYLLGSTLQDPGLSMPDPDPGKPVLKYGGISRQKRSCGMLFDAPAVPEIAEVYPVIEKGKGGRPQHAYWSFQHRNVLLIQRIARQKPGAIGSYSTGRISIRFDGKSLKTMEEGGWIFADNGKAFVGVRFLDGAYRWADDGREAIPVEFDDATDTSRLLMHAGDVTTHGSFEKFRAELLANRLEVKPDQVEYRFGPDATHLEMTLFDGNHPDRFTLPCVDGKPVNLRPLMTYQSPYLNADFGSDRITVTVGPIQQVLDFSTAGQAPPAPTGGACAGPTDVGSLFEVRILEHAMEERSEVQCSAGSQRVYHAGRAPLNRPNW